MIILKLIIIFLIILICTYIGIIKSRKYLYRVQELKSCLESLNIFKNKVTFTSESIPSIFYYLSSYCENNNISKIFRLSSEYMKKQNAQISWNKALIEVNTNLEKEDISSLKTLGNLLRENR